MKQFIFPANYNRKEKFLGMVEYKTIIVIASWGAFLFYLLKFFGWAWIVKVYVFLIFFGIPSIFLLVGFNGENMLDVVRYLVKYSVSPKEYVYRKKERG
ncbi:MAG: hypothetical protein J6M02_04145 [Clostridia bacterium]|nr:hypothetical protein [Clostridia bacterium]